MKRYGNLYSLITDKENIELAFKKASLNKSRQKQIRLAKEHKDEIIESVHQMLVNKTYHTSEYRTKIITEPKLRTICMLPFYPDRIVHHAIMNVIEPILDKKLIYDCYSTRIGKGQIKATERCKHYCKKYKYVLKCDISKFYPSINHAVLKDILRHIFKDSDLLSILDEIIDSTHTKTNIPIGNYLSQWFGNIYLNELDRFVIKQGFSKIIRYCDDFIIFSNSKEELNQLKPKIVEFLDEHLKLKLSKAQISKCDIQGVTFLGYRHIQKPTQRILLKRETLKRIKTRLKCIQKIVINNKNIDRCRSQISSAIGWIQHTDCFNLYRDLDLSTLAEKVKLFQYDFRIMHNFSDFAEPTDVIGTKVSIKDILNKDIIIYGYKVYHKHDHDFLKIVFKTNDDDVKISFTSSKILKKLLNKYKKQIPFGCKITKINNSYRFD